MNKKQARAHTPKAYPRAEDFLLVLLLLLRPSPATVEGELRVALNTWSALEFMRQLFSTDIN
ncbi:MAG: hypothetical protein WKF84_07925 [Pyrinomonadaceae bacterium]